MRSPAPDLRGVRRLPRLAAEEAGLALPVVIIVLAVAIVLMGVAVAQSGIATGGANQDRRVKRAIQAADAGLDAAVYRMNKFDVTRAVAPCVSPVGAVLALVPYAILGGERWCPPVSEDLGGGASYTYWVQTICVPPTLVTCQNPPDGIFKRTVVSQGTVDGVTRRVAMKVQADTGSPLFQNAGLISLLDLNMPNSSAVYGNAKSGGNISLSNSATICSDPTGAAPGNATPGPGRAVTTGNSSSVCGSQNPSPDPVTLSPVDQGTSATVNDDWRICNPLGLGAPTAGLLGDACTPKTNWYAWDRAARTLEISNSGWVTLGGNLYSFCRLTMSNNSTLKITPKTGGAVRIFIDTPEACGGAGGAVLDLQNGVQLEAPPGATPTQLQIYVAGSSTIPTTVNLGNNPDVQVPMVLYAPSSTVNLRNRVKIKGAIAANQVTFENNTDLTWTADVDDLKANTLFPLFQRSDDYRECSPTIPADTAPATKC
jgi:hypothetical protein